MKYKREGSLDLLKCIATCIIIMHHYQQITNTVFEGHINFYFGNFQWAYFVELFFLISGYFTYKYTRSSTADTFFAFFWKKYTRFLPLLFLTGGASILFDFYLSIINGTAFPNDVWACLAGMFGFSRWFSESLVVNNPTWYISVLLICYAVFYFANFLAKKLDSNPSTTFLAVVILGILMSHICNNYAFSMPLFSTSIGRGLLSFFLGLLLRDVMETYKIHEKPICVLACGLYLAGFITVYVKQTAYINNNLYYLLCFTVFPCILILFKCRLIHKLCSSNFFSALGNISYHAFMWHLLVLLMLIQVYGAHNISVGKPPVMYLSVAIALSVGSISFGISQVISTLRSATKVSGKSQ